jgi:hypothetical protein
MPCTLPFARYIWPKSADLTFRRLAASTGRGGRHLCVPAGAVQLAEEIGFTGFLQHHWQDRHHALKLTLYVALLWAVWHVPDHFAEEGWELTR